MGLAGSSDSGLWVWCILAVDVGQSTVGLVEVGESGASASRLQGGRSSAANMSFTLEVVRYLCRSNEQPFSAGITSRLLMSLVL